MGRAVCGKCGDPGLLVGPALYFVLECADEETGLSGAGSGTDDLDAGWVQDDVLLFLAELIVPGHG